MKKKPLVIAGWIVLGLLAASVTAIVVSFFHALATFN